MSPKRAVLTVSVLAAALSFVVPGGAAPAEARPVPGGCFALTTGSVVHREIMDPGAHVVCVSAAMEDDACLYRFQVAGGELARRGCGENTSGTVYECVLGLTVAYDYALFYNCTPTSP